ncbi:MAG TPA: NAD-dependent epimerase/dehydratase family protein [Ktedonobacterales bacterium]|nr:NAD-dependent epimerase/dehydratase family protein [Ktedonobacterales bacterium]
MRILVPGGTGFIGPAVVTRLSDLGHEIAVFHRGQTSADLPPAVQHILGDRRDLAAYADTFKRFAPEVVLDMQPMFEQDARVVVGLFTGLARRTVAISSQDVYRAYGRLRGAEPGSPDPVPLTEESPLRERLYPYRGETPRSQDDPDRWMDEYDKILVERVYLGAAHLPGTVLRLPMVYGPRDGQHRFFDWLKRMDDQRPAILMDERVASWRWTRGYVENVAAAIALAVVDERAVGRVYNVGEVEAPTWAEWARKTAQVVGWQGALKIVPPERLPRHLQTPLDTRQHLLTGSSRIRQELGYTEPVPLDEALRHTIAWERANPPAPIDPRQFDYAAEDAALAALEAAGG